MRLYLCQHLLIFNDVLVCGEQHVELAAAQDGNKCSASSWRPLGKNRNAFNFLTTAEIGQILQIFIRFFSMTKRERPSKEMPLTL